MTWLALILFVMSFELILISKELRWNADTTKVACLCLAHRGKTRPRLAEPTLVWAPSPACVLPKNGREVEYCPPTKKRLWSPTCPPLPGCPVTGHDRALRACSTTYAPSKIASPQQLLRSSLHSSNRQHLARALSLLCSSSSCVHSL